METPRAQALGEHTFRYSLVFHRGDWETAGVWRAAERAVLPLVVGRGPVTTGAPQSIEVEPDCVQVTACTPRDGGLDLRILNASDHPREAVVRMQPEPRSVSRTSLDGRAGRACTVTAGTVRLEVRPWEIATLAVTR
jgi:alpha-mannosidase